MSILESCNKQLEDHRNRMRKRYPHIWVHMDRLLVRGYAVKSRDRCIRGNFDLLMDGYDHATSIILAEMKFWEDLKRREEILKEENREWGCPKYGKTWDKLTPYDPTKFEDF